MVSAFAILPLPERHQVRIIIRRTLQGYAVTGVTQGVTLRITQYRPDLDKVARDYRKLYPKATVIIERR